MGKHLLEKVWEKHKVAQLPTGQDQLFVGLHLIHEVTSPQAFAMLRERGIGVLHPERTFATVDHIVPTTSHQRPFGDSLAEKMIEAIEQNTKEFGIEYFGPEGDSQGIVHVVGPELGLTQPGMVIVCGDSHTSTHGAFGSIALGIGTSQIRDVLASQTISLTKPKVRRIDFTGTRSKGVYAKDMILKIMAQLGVTGGIGYAYEYGGSAVEALSMEERMTLCNMSIEGGARMGYINPDQTTYDFIRGRPYAPSGQEFENAIEYWNDISSDADARYDDRIKVDTSDLSPMVTWGINPGQAIAVDQDIPALSELPAHQRAVAERAYSHMGFSAGQRLLGKKIDIAFLGSCTNGRLSDLRQAARVVQGKKVASHVTALAVPGSKKVKIAAEKEGLHEIFLEAGFQWRQAGCSMCLAMNPDRLKGDQLSASSSNRNFIGRQGSPKGRTLLMSPAMVAAAAITGEVTDVRTIL